MWHLIVSIMKTLQGARACPKCGNRQVESSDKRTETVTRQNCGAEIPPKKENS